jgi:hypothetical protein
MKRLITLCLASTLVTAACGHDQLLELNRAGPPALPAKALQVGDQVLIWTSASLPPESTFELIVVGPIEEARPPECPAPYPFHAVVVNHGPDSGRSGWWSEQPLAIGTKLSFIRYVTDCGGFYVAYAFNVISAPGK